MTSGHSIVSVKFVKEYPRRYKEENCYCCGINLLEYVNMNNKPLHRHGYMSTTKYRCDTCYQRLFGGVSLWKDYPEKVIIRNE